MRLLYIISISIFILNNVYAYNLNIQSRLIPKILKYQKYRDYTKSDSKIAIIANRLNINSALILKDRLDKNNLYTVINFADEDINYKDISAIFLFKIDKSKIVDIVNKANKNNILMFASSKDILSQGAHIYIKLLKKVNIFYNYRSINRSKILFELSFLKAVKVFNESN